MGDEFEDKYKKFLESNQEYFFGKLCELKGRSLTGARQLLEEHTEKILEEIETSRGLIQEFTIGKTIARSNGESTFESQTFETWDDNAIKGRWRDYQSKNSYNCMIVLCGLTRDCLPDSDKQTYGQPNNDSEEQKRLWENPEMWAFAFEQSLIHHFAFRKYDRRLGNKSLDTGGKSDEIPECGVVYIAVKLDPRFNSFEDFLQQKRKGYSANLCLENKPFKHVKQYLIQQCKATLGKLECRGKIVKFTIGWSHATYRTEGKEKTDLNTRIFSTWNVAHGIGKLWDSLEKEYDSLVVLFGVTKVDGSPKNQNQHDYIKDLHEALETAFEKEEKDERFEKYQNKEKFNNGEICGAIFVAVKVEKRKTDQRTPTEENKSDAKQEPPAEEREDNTTSTNMKASLPPDSNSTESTETGCQNELIKDSVTSNQDMAQASRQAENLPGNPRLVCKGTIHQGDIANGGRQCLCIALSFLCKGGIPKDPSEVDSLLEEGTNLFRSICGHDKGGMLVTELPPCVSVFDEDYECKFYNPRSGLCQTPGDNENTFCVKNALEACMKETSTLLLTLGDSPGATIALKKMEHSIFLFDSHPRDDRGLQINSGIKSQDSQEGEAVVLSFSNIDELSEHVKKLAESISGNNIPFEITAVSIRST